MADFVNYFQFFDLEEKYSLDKNLIRKRYLDISRKSHPDYFKNATKSEQLAAEKTSVTNNNAYATLNDDRKRVEHLLILKGFLNTKSEDNIEKKLSVNFLGEMMDLNEEVEKLLFEKNPAQNEMVFEKINQMIHSNNDQMVAILQLDIIPANKWNEILKLFLEQKYLLQVQNKVRNIVS